MTLNQPNRPLSQEWSECQQLILHSIDNQSEFIDQARAEFLQIRIVLAGMSEQLKVMTRIEAEVQKHNAEIAELKVKAGVWGGISVVVAAVGTVLMGMIKK